MDLNKYLIKKDKITPETVLKKIKIFIFSHKLLSLCIVLLLLITILFAGSAKTKNNDVTTISSLDIENTEAQLAKVLSDINGVGKISVMISYEGGMKKVIAYDTTLSNDKTTQEGRATEYLSENKSPVTVSVSGTSTPLVLQELKPEITGVIVVAEGANNIKVRLNLLSAVKTVLNIPSEKVEVFSMN